jgi:hypothetical protein
MEAAKGIWAHARKVSGFGEADYLVDERRIRR